MSTASWDERRVVDREVEGCKEAGFRENLIRADGMNAQEELKWFGTTTDCWVPTELSDAGIKLRVMKSTSRPLSQVSKVGTVPALSR